MNRFSSSALSSIAALVPIFPGLDVNPSQPAPIELVEMAYQGQLRDKEMPSGLPFEKDHADGLNGSYSLFSSTVEAADKSRWNQSYLSAARLKLSPLD